MLIRPATAADIPAITAIYNHAVRHTLAIWNEAEVSTAERQAWWQARQAAGYPVLVTADETAAILGYAGFGDWRAFAGFRHTAEHSVYVHPEHQGRGVGKALLQALVVEARACGKHVLVGGIESGNQGSIALHQSLGFVCSGNMPQVGCKFGRWLDLQWWQLQLDQAAAPPP